MAPAAAVAAALLLAGYARPVAAISCYVSRCEDNSPMPCWNVETVHEQLECDNAPAVSSQYGAGLTALGNPYDACQKKRLMFPGAPDGGEVQYLCASTLQSEQQDYKCGLCDESGSSGCSNDWLGVGYDVQSGSVTTTYWCCSGHNCNVRCRCGAAALHLLALLLASSA